MTTKHLLKIKDLTQKILELRNFIEYLEKGNDLEKVFLIFKSNQYELVLTNKDLLIKDLIIVFKSHIEQYSSILEDELKHDIEIIENPEKV